MMYKACSLLDPHNSPTFQPPRDLTAERQLSFTPHSLSLFFTLLQTLLDIVTSPMQTQHNSDNSHTHTHTHTDTHTHTRMQTQTHAHTHTNTPTLGHLESGWDLPFVLEPQLPLVQPKGRETFLIQIRSSSTCQGNADSRGCQAARLLGC